MKSPIERCQQLVPSLLVSFAILCSGPALAKAIGTLMVVKGKVFIVNKKGKKKRAKIGKKVHSRDTIITQKDSRAKIVMLDKNVIHISPASQMNFEKYVFNPKAGKKDVLLNVLYGKVRSNVKQKYDKNANRFRVKTKAAVAGVRGTDFLSGYSPKTNRAQFVTFEGMVEVGQPGPGGKLVNAVQVAPGQFTVAAEGQAPKAPQKVSAKQMARLDSSTQIDGSEGGDTDASGQEKRTPAGDEESASEDGETSGGDENQKEGGREDSAQKEEGGQESGEASSDSGESGGEKSADKGSDQPEQKETGDGAAPEGNDGGEKGGPEAGGEPGEGPERGEAKADSPGGGDEGPGGDRAEGGPDRSAGPEGNEGGGDYAAGDDGGPQGPGGADGPGGDGPGGPEGDFNSGAEGGTVSDSGGPGEGQPGPGGEPGQANGAPKRDLASIPENGAGGEPGFAGGGGDLNPAPGGPCMVCDMPGGGPGGGPDFLPPPDIAGPGGNLPLPNLQDPCAINPVACGAPPPPPSTCEINPTLCDGSIQQSTRLIIEIQQ